MDRDSLIREGLSLTGDEIRSFCQGRIAHDKGPRYIEFVPQFPVTVTGKIQKFMIRDQIKEELKLQADKTA